MSHDLNSNSTPAWATPNWRDSNPDASKSRSSSSYELPRDNVGSEQQNIKDEELEEWQDNSDDLPTIPSSGNRQGFHTQRSTKQARELIHSRKFNQTLQKSLEREQQQRDNLERSNHDLQAKLAAAEKQLQEATETNSTFEAKLTAAKAENEELRNLYQEEMRKKTAKIEELHEKENDLKQDLFDANLELETKELLKFHLASEDEKTELKKKLFESDLELENDRFFQGDFLNEEPSVDCKSLQSKLNRANRTIKGLREKIELWRPMVISCYFIRHRFLMSKEDPRDRNVRDCGNRSAHDGNIIVDASFFKDEFFHTKEHREAFQKKYGRGISLFLDRKLDFSVLKKLRVVCGILNLHATMVEYDSFGPHSLDLETDREFLVLYQEFKDKWFRGSRRYNSETLASLEETPEVISLHERMRVKMKSIARLSTERRRPQGLYEPRKQGRDQMNVAIEKEVETDESWAKAGDGENIESGGTTQSGKSMENNEDVEGTVWSVS
ncbi:hypothetical protein HYALB_00010728 [Hymenoscyphus albidus]|uniref:Uncharacterized protein n=1 Tax=Hymenoscyphus albidus TaxID=595503 RepID=A0A9N9LRQ4_9HELO|nr:hypothetical protein HYALB_00010728 [Hymenoscyphus albidus]